MEADIRFFLTVTLNGLTLAALYFLVASGFTLVFGLMRVLNLAHGVVYLFGAYVGFDVMEATGSWTLAIIVGGIAGAVFGLLVHVAILSWMPSLRRLQQHRQAHLTHSSCYVAAARRCWNDMRSGWCRLPPR